MRHYFDHIAELDDWESQIFFSKRSLRDRENPWFGERRVVESWNPDEADLLVLGGMDWHSLPRTQRGNWPVPIVNLIQGARHADPANPRFRFLRNRAIRVCVSSDVQRAIEATGEVNGPVFTVPAALDPNPLPNPIPWADRPIEVLIAGIKNPRLGRQVYSALRRQGISQTVLRRHIPRQRFLEHLASAKVAVFLPFRSEGLYLPPLEAMALGTIVVCPDIVGSPCSNRSCLTPPYTRPGLVDAVKEALGLGDTRRKKLLAGAAEVVTDHALDLERRRVQEIVRGAAGSWADHWGR